MNKIVLDKEEFIVVTRDLEIVVPDDLMKEVYLCSKGGSYHINYQLGKNSHLTVYHYSMNTSFDISVHLMKEEASISYFYNTISEEDQTFLFSIFHEDSKTHSHVFSHGVNTGDHSLVFDIYPHVLKESELCVCNQESNIINLGLGSSTIRPNLLIDHYNVLSSHSAYIGTFLEEELFYLMSRGLSRDVSYALLLESFLVKDKEKLEKIFPKFLEKLKEL